MTVLIVGASGAAWNMIMYHNFFSILSLYGFFTTCIVVSHGMCIVA